MTGTASAKRCATRNSKCAPLARPSSLCRRVLSSELSSAINIRISLPPLQEIPLREDDMTQLYANVAPSASSGPKRAGPGYLANHGSSDGRLGRADLGRATNVARLGG